MDEIKQQIEKMGISKKQILIGSIVMSVIEVAVILAIAIMIIK